mgnify:CR=1 FL=1
MNVLVVGGAGYIGSHCVRQALAAGHAVAVLDDLSYGHAESVPSGVELFRADMGDEPAVRAALRARRADVVIDFAAFTNVGESVRQPERYHENNVVRTEGLLRAMLAEGVRKLVFASSAAIYGDNPVVPKVESMLPEPKSPYAITKLDGEYYLDLFRREGRLETAAIRFFNVFGPRQDPKGAYAAAVPIFIDKAVKGEDITIFGDGGQTRDFIYVKDIVGALAFAAANPAVAGTYNVGYGRKMTVKELAQEVIRLTGSTSAIEHKPERLGDVKHSLASADKLRAAGWSPQHTVAEGLDATVAYFRSLKA